MHDEIIQAFIGTRTRSTIETFWSTKLVIIQWTGIAVNTSTVPDPPSRSNYKPLVLFIIPRMRAVRTVRELIETYVVASSALVTMQVAAHVRSLSLKPSSSSMIFIAAARGSTMAMAVDGVGGCITGVGGCTTLTISAKASASVFVEAFEGERGRMVRAGGRMYAGNAFLGI